MRKASRSYKKNVERKILTTQDKKGTVDKESEGIKGIPAFKVGQPQPIQVHIDIFSSKFEIEISLSL